MTIGFLARAMATTARICVPTLVEAAVGRLDSDVCDARLEAWSRRLLESARITVQVSGQEHAKSGESFVVMSNHQSLYDIPVLFYALGRRIRMVTKRELFRIPVWGSAMRVAGFIEVDRQDHERAVESMKRAAESIRGGTDIWISPEGTRSRDGRLLAFRKGGFHLALDTGARILPVTVDGTRRVLAAGEGTVHPGAMVSVTIHPPIDPAAYGSERIDELMEAVRNSILSSLGAASKFKS